MRIRGARARNRERAGRAARGQQQEAILSRDRDAGGVTAPCHSGRAGSAPSRPPPHCYPALPDVGLRPKPCPTAHTPPPKSSSPPPSARLRKSRPPPPGPARGGSAHTNQGPTTPRGRPQSRLRLPVSVAAARKHGAASTASDRAGHQVTMITEGMLTGKELTEKADGIVPRKIPLSPAQSGRPRPARLPRGRLPASPLARSTFIARHTAWQREGVPCCLAISPSLVPGPRLPIFKSVNCNGARCISPSVMLGRSGRAL